MSVVRYITGEPNIRLLWVWFGLASPRISNYGHVVNLSMTLTVKGPSDQTRPVTAITATRQTDVYDAGLPTILLR